MKSQHIKEHQTKPQYTKQLDTWGDDKFLVEGKLYDTKEEAKKAIHEMLTEEFNSRNKKD